MSDNEKKAKAKLHNELYKLLTTNCENDGEFFQNLFWALEIITNELSYYNDYISYTCSNYTNILSEMLEKEEE